MKQKFTTVFLALCFIGALLFSTSAFAQRTIKGKVTSASDNQPVAGATVQVKGTSTGTVTGADGTYSLSVPGNNAVLDFSFIGFNRQEVGVGSQSTINVTLVENASNLNELVVTGYTSQRKGDITGAVSTVKAADLVAIPEGSAEQQLQGRVPGVTVISSGQPGTTNQIRIRGFSSFSNNAPLYVVDGIPTFDISDINSNDIATITVLKDAGSASIYGTRASNGVVLITTKKGTPGKLKVTYSGSYGWQFPGNGYSLLNPTQTAAWTWKAYQNAGEDPTSSSQAAQYGTGATPVLPDYILAGTKYGVSASDPATNPDLYDATYIPATGHLAYQIIKANKAGTNWYDEVTRVAPIQNHSLSLSGGTENSRYNISFGYFNQQGIILSTYLKRYTVRANTEFNIKDRLKIGENIQVELRDNPTLGGGTFNGNQGEGNAISWTYRENPLIPVYDIKGNWAGTVAKGFNNPENPVSDQVHAKDNRGSSNLIFGNVYAQLSLPYYLTLKTTFGGYYGNYYFTNYGWRTYQDAEPVTSYSVSEGAGYNHTWDWSNTLNFVHKFGQHDINALVGVEAIKEGVGQNISGSGLNPFSWDLLYRSINTTQNGGRSVGDGPSVGKRLYSQFGQVNYNYADKYLLTATVRRDGSSVFGPNKKYGVFPAVSVGWRLSNESFLKGVTWINDLKLRGSYGQLGNEEAVPGSNQYSTYRADANTSYDIAGTNSSIQEALIRAGLSNLSSHWETNTTSNVGFDATLFNNSFTVVLDVYKKKTTGLLYALPLPPTVGIIPNGPPVVNVGSMNNTGFDLQLEKRGDVGKDFHYDVNLTFSHYKNEILELAPGVPYFDGNSFGSGRLGGTVTRNQPGHPLSAFFFYKVAGLWQSQAEIDAADATAASKSKGAQTTYQSGGEHPGEFKYVDVNKDGFITDDDRTFCGSPNPNFTYGLNIDLSYKNFDLSAFFYGTHGNDAFAYTKWFTDFFPSFPGGAISSRVLDSWTPQNTNTDIPIFEDHGSLSTNANTNSYYVEKASYMRCKNLQLGYTFNKGGVLQKAGFDHLKLFVQAVNLFTITKYDGLDPELIGVDNNFGVDYGNYPEAKQFIIGVNATF